ncbi:MAG: hypothetical protein HQP61_02255 [Peptococcaceae bacterium]|nr:hypothetical protein [Candidatus Syntrophopropionicum ammoniitolerans]
MGRRAIDLTNQTFGELTAKRQVDFKSKNAKWECVCSCGNIVVTESQKLRKGTSRSCGCKRGEYKIKTMGTHGMTNTRIYRIWHSMISRCEYPGTNGYEFYGGRGISVCEEWRNNFEAFHNWAVKNGYSDKMSIDRIDNSRNYEPSNCRWADKYTQDNNRRSNVYIEMDGKKHTIAEWSRITGINKETIRSRIRSGKTGKELFKKV